MATKPPTPQGERPLLNRKHISRAEREAQQRRIIVLALAGLVAAVAVLLVGGALFGIFVEPTQAMAEVRGETISRRDFYRRVNYERYRLFQVYEDTREQATELLADPQSASFIGQLFEQQLGQLNQAYAAIGAQTLETMIEERLIEEEAETRGVSVSDAEIDEEVRRQIARQEGAQIEVDVTATAEAAIAATATAAEFTPTPTLEPTATTRITATVTSEATLTPTATPAATLTPAPTLTPNILAQDSFDTAYETFLADLQRNVDFSEADYREVIRLQLLRDKVGEAYGAETEVATTEEQVHVAHVLVGKEQGGTLEEAEAVLARLEDGEDFAEVAAEVSDDTASAQNGGDLDWIGRGETVAPFEEAAFALAEPGELSPIVETQFGWHILQLIEGPEERDRTEDELQAERDTAFSDFLTTAKSGEDVRRFWNPNDLPDDPFIAQISRPLPTAIPQPTIIIPTPPADATPSGADEPADDEAAPPSDDEAAPEAGATETP